MTLGVALGYLRRLRSVAACLPSTRTRMYAYTRSTLAALAVMAVRAATARPASVLAALLLLTGGLGGYAVTHLGMNTNTEDMLDPELPFLAREREMARQFPALENLIVVVVEASGRARAQDVADRIGARLRDMPGAPGQVYLPGGGEYFARNGFLFLDTASLWQIDEQLADAEPFLGTMANDPSLRGLMSLLGRAVGETLTPANEAQLVPVLDRIAATLENARRGPPVSLSWLDSWFSAGAGTGVQRAFVLIQPQLDFTRFATAGDALDRVRSALAEPGLVPDGVRARITGSVAMENEELTNVAADAKGATLLSFVLVLGLLVLAFRSARVVVILLLTLATGLVWTGAFAAVVFGTLNLISVSFAVLFIGMGVDFGIQFAMRYREELSAGGTGVDALRRTAEGVGGALALAAAIAAVSFLAFTPTSYRGLSELGAIAGFSMLVALATSLTVLPAALRVAGVEQLGAGTGAVGLVPLARFIDRHRVAIVIAALLLTLASALVAPHVRFDFNPLNLRDPTTESVATFRALLQDPDSSPYNIDVLAPDLDAAGPLADRLAALPEVARTITLSSYVPTDQDEKLAVIADMRSVLQTLLIGGSRREPPTVAEDRAAVTRFRAALEAAHADGRGAAINASIARLRAALDVLEQADDARLQALERALVGDFPRLIERLRTLLAARPVTLQDLPADLRERYTARDGRVRIEVFPRADLSDNSALRRFVDAVQRIAPTATGAPIGLVSGGDVVIAACVQASALALAATLVLTLAILGSLASALLALVPLMLALCATLASSVVLDLPFNLANIIALPLLIGLANAYGIYYVMRKRVAGDIIELYAGSTPRAVMFSSLTTIASFGTLTSARHPGMAAMGALVTLALLYALLFTLILLPALMAMLDARRR